MAGVVRCIPGGIVPPRLAMPHAPGVGWLYVLDPDVGDDDWHIVRDLGLTPPKGRALCGQLPPSLGGWPAVTAQPTGLALHEVCQARSSSASE